MLIQIQKTTPFFINILNHVRNFSYTTTNHETLDVDVNDFENGIYLLCIEAGSVNKYIKVVKSK